MALWMSRGVSSSNEAGRAKVRGSVTRATAMEPAWNELRCIVERFCKYRNNCKECCKYQDQLERLIGRAQGGTKSWCDLELEMGSTGLYVSLDLQRRMGERGGFSPGVAEVASTASNTLLKASTLRWIQHQQRHTTHSQEETIVEVCFRMNYFVRQSACTGSERPCSSM